MNTNSTICNRSSENHRAKKQRGATLMEMMVWIAISLVIVAGAAAGIAAVFSSNDVNDDATNINQLLINTKRMHDVNGYGTSGTDLIPALTASNGVPSTLTVVSKVPYNAWNGAITITSTGLGYTLTTTNIPQQACIEESTKLSMPGTYSVSINGGSAITGVVSHAAATTGCSKTDSTNKIAFTSAS